MRDIASDDDLKRSKHVGVILIVLSVFMLNLFKCNCWLITETILRNKYLYCKFGVQVTVHVDEFL